MTLRSPESWDISGTAERLSASKQGLCSADLVQLKISLILAVVAVTNDFLCRQTTYSLWSRIILDVWVAITGNRSSSVDTVTRLQDELRVIPREVYTVIPRLTSDPANEFFG